MRQQFSASLNIKISQFAAEFVKNMRASWIMTLMYQNYALKILAIYLADNDSFAETLRENHAIQIANGAGTKLMSEEIKRDYPFIMSMTLCLARIIL